MSRNDHFSAQSPDPRDAEIAALKAEVAELRVDLTNALAAYEREHERLVEASKERGQFRAHNARLVEVLEKSAARIRRERGHHAGCSCWACVMLLDFASALSPEAAPGEAWVRPPVPVVDLDAPKPEAGACELCERGLPTHGDKDPCHYDVGTNQCVGDCAAPSSRSGR